MAVVAGNETGNRFKCHIFVDEGRTIAGAVVPDMDIALGGSNAEGDEHRFFILNGHLDVGFLV